MDTNLHTPNRRNWYRNEAGEGVISAAIVVLIMAVIGGAMFVVFNDAFLGASERIAEEVNTIVDSPQ